MTASLSKSSLNAFSRCHRGCPKAVASLCVALATPFLVPLPLEGAAAVPPDVCSWGRAARYLLLWGEGKTKCRGVKATASVGGCPLLDVVLQQSSCGDYTGLAVALVTVCCLSELGNFHIQESSIGTTSPKSESAETLAVVSRTGDMGSTYRGHWHSSGLYQSICLAQGTFHYGDAEIQETHMG